jgi:cell division protein FtsI/penicillin-binding protein 2
MDACRSRGGRDVTDDGMMTNVFQLLAANRVAMRRARNLRAAERVRSRAAHGRWRLPALLAGRPGAQGWVALAGFALLLAGAVVIAMHGRLLARASAAAVETRAEALWPLLRGVAFDVPEQAGVSLVQGADATLLIAAGMQPQGQAQVDLCNQVLDQSRPRLLPVRIGLPFAEVAKLAQTGAAPLRSVVLAGPGSDLPRIEITGTASPNFASGGGDGLSLAWQGGAAETSWVGDAGPGHAVAGEQGAAGFLQQGWLVLNPHEALRVVRRTSRACALGELLIELYRPAPQPGGPALVMAFAPAGKPQTLRLAPGSYKVPLEGPAEQEDRLLFEQLRAHGLVRVTADGLAELAPPDLAAWRAAPAEARATSLGGWDGPPLTAQERALLDRLYHKADGDYVREQVGIYNAERRLLAVRLRANAPEVRWHAQVEGAPAAMSASMPAGAARLFDSLPQGWGPWQRVSPGGAGDDATLTLRLPAPAAGGATLELLAAGHLEVVRGATERSREDACTGRGCLAAGAVQRLVLDLAPGARSIVFSARPMDAAGLGDPRYRHLRLADGQLEWQQLPQASVAARPALAPVALADRNGTPLWSAGKATAAARAAGLAPLLGLHAGHADSVAGMLARLPAPGGAPHRARLTLDLGLQGAAQAALECIGMRHGRLDGRTCSGGAAAPGREAGIVVLDTETGDILAAAGAGMPAVNDANWNEVLEFDRSDPARSPLRLPAFQHDGGSRRSPGSTFKIVTALGLELAARKDPQLDAILDGMPALTLNETARARGFAFNTDAAAYPAGTSRAHITNFHNERLTGREENGRLGLVQAMTYSLNSWFAFSAELSDRSLLGQPEGGAPGVLALEPGALDDVRPVLEMARRVGFGQALRLDGGLLPADYPWSDWDALRATPAHIDPIASRHELRQMAIGLRMQVTPLQMALASGAVGQGQVVAPRLLSELDGVASRQEPWPALGVRLDRIRAGMKGVVDRGTAASAFRAARFDSLRPGLYGKTGTAPTSEQDSQGRTLNTVWFTGWIEPGRLPGQHHRLAFAAFVSRSEATGGEHAAPIVAAVLRALQERVNTPGV